MKDNDLASLTITPMADSHFEITSKELGCHPFSEVTIKSVRAVLVDRVDPEVALIRFSAPTEEFKSALQAYSAAWEKYCADNDLVTGVFFLSPKIAKYAKALESHELDRIEEQRRLAAATSSISDDTD